MRNKNRLRTKNKELPTKKVIFVLIIITAIILIFTFVDYLIHQLKEEYAVPSYYYRNKMIFGTGIGFVTYLFIRKKKLLMKSLIFSAVIIILLQIRYFLEGFPLSFVFLFLVIHFLILFVLSLIVFWILGNQI